MASKFFCDRCGKEVEFIATELKIYSRANRDQIAWVDTSFDLCKNCKEDVIRFIGGKR